MPTNKERFTVVNTAGVKSGWRCPSSKPWAVVNPDSGKLHGCHETAAQARDQQKAIYANIKK